MRSMWMNLGVVVLVAASCSVPQLSELADPSSGSGSATNDAGAPSPVDLELVAGDIGGRGNLDGTGAAARFNNPSRVAVDRGGNIYVADEHSHTIRKITAAGIVTTLAGAAGIHGDADGTGAAARFSSPSGVAVDVAGNVYIADTGNHTIRKITSAGVVTTLAGTTHMLGDADATGAAARFFVPRGIAIDRDGNVYVADSANHTIRKVTAAGVVTTLAGTAGRRGSANGTGPAASFSFPRAVAVDASGNVYVADGDNHLIRKITAAGIVTTLAGTAGTPGSADGTGAAAQFHFPHGVAVDSASNVYVADRDNHTIRKVTATGIVTTHAGAAGISGSADGTGTAARFRGPSGVAIDSVGNLYIAEAFNHTIRKLTTARVVTTLAGAAAVSGSADGTGAAARFFAPFGVAADSTGNVYVADSANHTVRKVTAAAVVTTLAGTAGIPGSADGTGATARFTRPSSVAVDSTGNLYVADTDSHTIRKVTAAGAVTTLAGTPGTSGSADGAGADARFSFPRGIAVDSAGNIYVADLGNATIRKVTPSGIVTTLAGAPGVRGSADGSGAAARFNLPSGVAVDGAGNIYVADRVNHTIRKLTAAGVVTTLAGTPAPGTADGTGAAARFNFPSGVAVDSAGNVYVADEANSTIRKVTPTGTTTTVAGTAGAAGLRLGTTLRFAFPQALAIVSDSIVISDGNAIVLLRHGAR
jgi:hypothetical protein